MNRINGWIIATFFIAATVLSSFSCSKTSSNGSQESFSLELRSYAVPPEYASELRAIINDLLQTGTVTNREKIGQAEIGPGNMLLVTAPASIHSGIEKMLSDLKDTGFEPPPMISLTYWNVVGRPSDEAK